MVSPLEKEALRDAKVIEDLRVQRIKWRYAAVSTKIAAYSDGVGESPTPEEFKTWINDGKELERIRGTELASARARQLEDARSRVRFLGGASGGAKETSPDTDSGKDRTQPPEGDDGSARGAQPASAQAWDDYRRR